MTKDEAGNKVKVPPVTAQQILKRTRERKAKSTLLMAILDEHLARFHGIKYAKTLWAAIKIKFGGNAESKKMQKNVLKQQFEIFFVSNSEGLDKGYDRFQRLLSLLEIHRVGVSTEDANQNFLRYLPSAWSNISLIMRNKPDIDNLDIDDLYNNLKVYEADIFEIIFKITECHSSQAQGSSSYAHELMFSFFANQSSSPQLDNKDLEQIDQDDLEEINLKWQIECFNYNRKGHFARDCRTARNSGNRSRDAGNAGYRGRDNGKRPAREEDENALVVQDGLEEKVTKTVSDNRSSDEENSLANDRFKKGEGYHAVPPHLTGNFMPPKSDLSFAGLDDSIYKFKISETVTSLTKDEKDALETISAIKGNGVTAVKTLAGCVWRPRVNGHPHEALKKGIVNSGCSRHMTGNKAYLADYQKINDGGFVSFGSSKGKITGKGNQTDKNVGPKDTNGNAGTQDNVNARKEVFDQHYIVLPLWSSISFTFKSSNNKAVDDKPKDDTGSKIVEELVNKEDQAYVDELDRLMSQEKDASNAADALRKEFEQRCMDQRGATKAGSTNIFNTVSNLVNADGNQTDKNVGPKDTNGNAGTQDNVNARKEVFDQHYIVLPLWSSISFTFKSSNDKAVDDKPKDDTGSKIVEELVNKEDQAYVDELDRLMSQEKDASNAADALRKEFEQRCMDQRGATKAGSTNIFNTVSNLVNADEADFNNMESSTVVSPIPTHRVHIDHPNDQILEDPKSAVQIKGTAKKSFGAQALVSYIHKQRRTNHKDYENDLFACFLSQMDLVVQIVLWIVDSGCSKHMTGDRSLLRNLIEKFKGTVRFGNDNFVVTTGYGDYIMGNITICHVYYVEGLGHNLFSVGQFCDGDLEVAFRSKTCYVRNLEGDDLLTGGRESNMYTIFISDMAVSLPVYLVSKVVGFFTAYIYIIQ
nr:ribonuclease H-like domain-containing protein [Tanacetum cinerariifolium]